MSTENLLVTSSTRPAPLGSQLGTCRGRTALARETTPRQLAGQDPRSHQSPRRTRRLAAGRHRLGDARRGPRRHRTGLTMAPSRSSSLGGRVADLRHGRLNARTDARQQDGVRRTRLRRNPSPTRATCSRLDGRSAPGCLTTVQASGVTSRARRASAPRGTAVRELGSTGRSCIVVPGGPS